MGTRYLFFLGVGIVYLLLICYPVKSSILPYEERLGVIVHAAAEFGHACASAGMSREEMHELLRKNRKEGD